MLYSLCKVSQLFKERSFSWRLSAAAVVLGLFSAAVAYYAMWALGVVVFALAVYYTVKQL